MCSVIEKTYQVPDMSCGHCASSVTRFVESVPGVEAVAVDLDTLTVKVHGAGLDDEAIRTAISTAGFEAGS